MKNLFYYALKKYHYILKIVNLFIKIHFKTIIYSIVNKETTKLCVCLQ